MRSSLDSSRAPRGLAFAVVAIVAGCTSGNEPASTPSQAGDPWPGDQWAVSTPLAEGIDPAAVDALVADIEGGRYGLIDHFLLIRHGRVVADHHWDHHEEYVTLSGIQEDTTDHQYNYDHPSWHPLLRDTHLHTLQSVTKSVTSVALGIAVDEGHIPDVEVPAWSYLEAYAPDMTDSRRSEATLEDFLTMRSGIDWATAGETYTDNTHPTVILEGSDEWIRYVVDRPMQIDPGQQWDYNDGVSVLLGKIVREATGRRIDEWAQEKLFEPIGIDGYHWKLTPDGEVDTEGGLYLSAHDLARVGYLMLRGGEWNGRRVVSEDWVRASTAPIVSDINPTNDRPDPGYGYQWWVPVHEGGEAKVYAGNGYGGQFVHVAPEYDIVAVFNGWTLHERPELSTWTALQERILPATTVEPPVIDPS